MKTIFRESTPAIVPLEDKQAGEDLWQRYGAQRGVWTESMLLALERGVKGNKWFSLIDKVTQKRTLEMAWEKVRSNAGASGVDGMSIKFFEKDWQTRLLAVQERLKEDDYHPQAIKRVDIPKAGSRETRPLGIPTVTDRVVQAALKMVIEPIFEKEFSERSYGFRPGRGCKDALREVERMVKAGYVHVVDIDIQRYFDSIPHEALMREVERHLSDGRVLKLMKQFLKQGVLINGQEVEPEKGSPQGGIISPLLANIYLNPLDRLLEEAGLTAVRYADDLVILAKSEAAAQRGHLVIKQWAAQAGLTLHPDKTRQVDMSEPEAYFEFLGYKFRRSRRGKLGKFARQKSLKKLRARIKAKTRRNHQHSMEVIISQLTPILRGWFEYYQHSHESDHRAIDGWVRMRLRSILRKRQKRRGRGRGLDHRRWPNLYFKELGLYSLVEALEEKKSLRRGATC